MTDQQLLDALVRLGLDHRNVRLVAVMPLVYVAWADGKVRGAERKAVLKIADEHHLVGEGAQAVLDRWLTTAPTWDDLDLACDVIRELARRNGGLESGITPEAVGDVIAWCRRVAAAGTLGVMSTLEKTVIEDIGKSLRIAASEEGAGADWGEILQDLATGRFSDQGV
jgi:hypothetical protein